MVKKGDTVRYMNEVGGGIVTRVEGKIAFVLDDGFERPVPANEVVVVLPAGHQPTSGARLMFDQQAYDTGRTSKRNKSKSDITESSVETPAITDTEKNNLSPQPEIEDDFPIEETDYGDSMNVLIAFEPKDLHQLDKTWFNMVLVNDSNYFLSYQLLQRAPKAGEWEDLSHGEIAPNEIRDLKRIQHDDIPRLERLVFQAIAYKKDKTFTVKEPLYTLRKVDLTKFFKYHCFHKGLYFDEPVLEIPLYSEAIRK